MKDDIRFSGFDRSRKFLEVADVPPNVSYFLRESGNDKIVLLRDGVQSVTCHICPELQKPQCKPGTFETGMTRDEDVFAIESFVEKVHFYQTFQKAWPLSQSLLRYFTSLS